MVLYTVTEVWRNTSLMVSGSLAAGSEPLPTLRLAPSGQFTGRVVNCSRVGVGFTIVLTVLCCWGWATLVRGFILVPSVSESSVRLFSAFCLLLFVCPCQPGRLKARREHDSLRSDQSEHRGGVASRYGLTVRTCVPACVSSGSN